MKLRYELWYSDSDNSYDFFPADNASARKLLTREARLVKVIEAETWEDAQKQKNEYLGLAK